MNNPKLKLLVIAIFICLVVPCGVTSGQQSGEQAERSLSSFVEVDDLPLFKMTFYGDYDRLQGADERTKEAIEQREPKNNDSGEGQSRDGSVRQLLATPSSAGWACSIFVAHGDGSRPLYGRNFDWNDNPAMLLFTDPSDGYASVSMVDISYLGFESDDEKYKTVEGRRGLLDAPLIPFDGMNEHGLTVGMAAVPNSPQPFDAQKPSFHGLGIIRMMLDKAKTVDEALAQFDEFNIITQGGPQIHYLIADAEGASALVELKDAKLHVFRNDGPFHLATNFYFCGNEDDPNSQCHRYATIVKRMNEQEGRLNVAETFALLKAVSQQHTRWSAVYDMKGRQISVVTDRRFGQVHEFKLKP